MLNAPGISRSDAYIALYSATDSLSSLMQRSRPTGRLRCTKGGVKSSLSQPILSRRLNELQGWEGKIYNDPSRPRWVLRLPFHLTHPCIRRRIMFLPVHCQLRFLLAIGTVTRRLCHPTDPRPLQVRAHGRTRVFELDVLRDRGPCGCG